MKRSPFGFLTISACLIACSSGNGERPDSATIGQPDGATIDPDGGAPPDAVDGATADASDAGAPPPWKGPRVVVVVWPGLRPDMVTPDDTPTLERFRKEGVELGDHHAVFPTTTMANAASLATGLGPARHGVLGSTLFQQRLTGLDARDNTIDTKRPFWAEDHAVLEHLDGLYSGRLLPAPTFLEAARAAGARTAAIGMAGAASLQDLHRSGVIADDDFVWPISAAQSLQNAGLPLPANIITVFPSDLLLAADNGNPTAATPLGYRVADGFLDPSVLVEPAHQAADSYFVSQVVPTLFSGSSAPDVSVIWLHDPEATLQAYGPGSNMARLGVEVADASFGVLLGRLDQLAPGTDVIVVSDHGQSTVSGPLAIFPLRIFLAINNLWAFRTTGYSGSGAVRLADLLLKAGFQAYDSNDCLQSIDLAGYLSPSGSVYPTLTDDDNGTRCDRGGLYQYTNQITPAPDKLPAGSVVVAENGGSELLYVPGGEQDIVAGVVRYLQSRPEIGPIFVSRRYGKLPGTLDMERVGLEPAGGVSSDPGRFPDIVVSYGWNDSALVQGAPGISYSSMLNRRGSTGSFSPRDVTGVLFARGPSFRAATSTSLPSSTLDIAPTVAKILGIELPAGDGRPLLEALVPEKGGVPESSYTVTDGLMAPEQPATALTMHQPTSTLAQPDVDHPNVIDPTRTSYTIELRTKTVTGASQSVTYFDFARAIRN